MTVQGYPAAVSMRFHQEPAEAAVAVRVGVDVHEQEVAQHHAHRRVGFVAQQLEQRRHRVAGRGRARQHVICALSCPLAGVGWRGLESPALAFLPGPPTAPTAGAPPGCPGALRHGHTERTVVERMPPSAWTEPPPHGDAARGVDGTAAAWPARLSQGGEGVQDDIDGAHDSRGWHDTCFNLHGRPDEADVRHVIAASHRVVGWGEPWALPRHPEIPE